MDEYEATLSNYDAEPWWHAEKSDAYSWTNQIDLFCAGLLGPRVLDVGCGGGRDIAEFLARGYEVEGVDSSKGAISVCTERYPQVVVHASDMRDMDLPGGSYDGVWACASVLNLKRSDVSAALSEFRRVLKSGGHLFVSVKEGSDERMVRDRAGERLFSFYSEDELARLVRGAGFAVERTERVSDAELTGRDNDSEKRAWVCVYAVAP